MTMVNRTLGQLVLLTLQLSLVTAVGDPSLLRGAKAKEDEVRNVNLISPMMRCLQK